ELSGGVAGELDDARIHAGVAEVGRPRDVEPLHPAVARLEVRARLARKRVAVAVVAASDDVEHERGVTDRARDGSHVGDAGEPTGKPTSLRHAAVRRPEALTPAERRRGAGRAARPS